ncbi:MAG: hypothetical protein ACTH31_06260, partial [Pseudoclavibacter sp.]
SLAQLADAGALTTDDLDRMLEGEWAHRFPVRADPEQRHRPAIVTLAVAGRRSEHPMAPEVFERLAAGDDGAAGGSGSAVDGEDGSPPGHLRDLLLGWYGDEADVDRLWLSARLGDRFAATGWTVLTARLEGIRVSESASAGALRSGDEGGLPGTREALAEAAIAWGASSPVAPLERPTSPLWAERFDDRALAWFVRAIDVAGDETLAVPLRAWALRLARSHRVLLEPERVLPHLGAATVVDARDRVDRLRDELPEAE